ncbi:hypothetical protein VN12_13720 [Pirellula sp. SH-Sr6A]|uniref:hypothetical protein n=1 Tax=Pirellula sp. SH-Sr6A TaxID=1632865 RepID=UPI00078EC446|nr:hypothetical protein [Pirellula sp. SH-Sr6A]AMV33179.1 hypothetical protein VN12_13720 [Pirellula sp. SH-Sr6A]
MTESHQSTFEKLLTELAHQRDELRLKIHLGNMEAKEQLGKLEERLFELRQRYAPTKEAIDETAEEVWESLKSVGGEILEGFHRIRKSL